MDRLTWYQPGESTEEILIQAGHVGIYDGDLKQSTFEQGTASLTLQRVIWADSKQADCRLILHHSLVERIDRHHKTMFGKGGKIIVTLKPVGPTQVQGGPIAASGFNYLRFVFKNGGEEDFYKRYAEALSRQMWKRTSSSSSSGGSSRNSNVHSGSISGQSGHRIVERRATDNQSKIQETISQGFTDMSQLFERATGLVNETKILAERLRLSGDDSVTEEDTINNFKLYLLKLGINDIFGNEAVYFEKLAEDVCDLLTEPLKDIGGSMSLLEAYCYINRVNRLRNVDLISPEDLLNSCKRFGDLNFPISLNTSSSGVIYLQLLDYDKEEPSTCVNKRGSTDQSLMLKELPPEVAMERLLIAESQSKLSRDETDEGLVFCPNRFDHQAESTTNQNDVD